MSKQKTKMAQDPDALQYTEEMDVEEKRREEPEYYEKFEERPEELFEEEEDEGEEFEEELDLLEAQNGKGKVVKAIIQVADKLDKIGMHKEADKLDDILKKIL